MKAGFVVSLAAALALMTAIPTAAVERGLGHGCSGMLDEPCDADLVCEHKTCRPPELVLGICALKCPQITGPQLVVCGCDGQTYSDDCVRQQAGASLAHVGKCQ